jgi:hypothetical protein
MELVVVVITRTLNKSGQGDAGQIADGRLVRTRNLNDFYA